MELTKSIEVQEDLSQAPEPDEEFDEALRRASSKIDEMAARALRAHAEGRTRPFPE